MSAHAIEDFLSVSDLRETLYTIGNLATQAAAGSAEVRQDLAAIGSWWATVDPQPERLLPILYLKAQDEKRSKSLNSPSDVAKRAKQVRAALRSFNRSAVRNLLLETEARIEHSDSLARKLTVAREDISAIEPDMEAIARKLVPLLQEHGIQTEEASDAMEKEQGQLDIAEPETNALRCYAFGVRAPCWLVISLIILSIILI